MSYVRVDLTTPIENGQTLTFRSPADCSSITGLKVYYKKSGSTSKRIFQFADAHGNNVGSTSLFAEDVLVKVILDMELDRAYVQNADTNAYLEGRLNKLGIESEEHPGCFYRVIDGNVEWINPPLLDGKYYRTTERDSQGNPIYIVTIHVDRLPNYGEELRIPITSHKDSTGVFPIFFELCATKL